MIHLSARLIGREGAVYLVKMVPRGQRIVTVFCSGNPKEIQNDIYILLQTYLFNCRLSSRKNKKVVLCPPGSRRGLGFKV